jgi:hypothetical protein
LSTRIEKRHKLTLTFLSISLIGFIATTTISNTVTDTLAQNTPSMDTEKKNIFKVIMTVRGLDHNSGDIITIVSVNGESRVKLFDDAKTYIHTVNATDGTGGIIEYVATFPNMTVNIGDEYKVCALTIQDSNLMCQTGNDSPASRPEFVGLFVQEKAPTASQAAMVSDDSEE